MEYTEKVGKIEFLEFQHMDKLYERDEEDARNHCREFRRCHYNR